MTRQETFKTLSDAGSIKFLGLKNKFLTNGNPEEIKGVIDYHLYRGIPKTIDSINIDIVDYDYFSDSLSQEISISDYDKCYKDLKDMNIEFFERLSSNDPKDKIIIFAVLLGASIEYSLSVDTPLSKVEPIIQLSQKIQ